MLFNSSAFVYFFLVVYVGYLLLRRKHKLQNYWLLAASYAFYGAWDYRFLSLILFSTWLDFQIGKRMEASDGHTSRLKLLRLSIVANLGVLGLFKYFNFFIQNFCTLFSIPPDKWSLSLILPVGISFYTFQSLSYSIDVYRERSKACQDFADFALYISFFPQLVAGPIERAKRLIIQIQTPRTITAQDIEVGLYLIVYGYYTKMVVADNIGTYVVDAVFEKPGEFGGVDIFLATVGFALQIYGDFNGYSSIARGLARLMGFRLILNFNLPYFALTPSDFWRRWHISLSQWLRDYLYIPLGGNRGTEAMIYRNLMLTMILGGLWHGAAWNFCLWGLFHGFILCLYRVLGIKESAKLGVVQLQWAVMSLLTLLGWLIFRVESMEHLGLMWNQLSFSTSAQTLTLSYELLLFATPLVLLEVFQHRNKDLLLLLRGSVLRLVLSITFALLSIIILGVAGGSQFLYFQF